MSTTVEELRARLRSPDQVVREAHWDPAHDLNGTRVFRTRSDGSCETWLRERGVSFHHRVFPDEAEAVLDAEAQIFQTAAPEPGPAPEPDPVARTVEELKSAMVARGVDPDEVTRGEVLRDSPKVDGMLVVTGRPDGTVSTASWERGVTRHEQAHSSEAEAVQESLQSLVRRTAGRTPSLTAIETGQIHLDQYLDLLASVRRR